MKTERTGLEEYGFTNLSRIHWNLPTPALYEQIINRNEGMLAHLGPVVVRTGHHTGRSPNDKFVVDEPETTNDVYWSKENKKFTEEQFDKLLGKMASYLQTKEVFVQECYAGADEDTRLKVRVVTENAWHSMFARNMFIREKDVNKLDEFQPDFTVVDCPRFHADPETDGTNSETFIIINFKRRMVIIGGTSYAGEIKKSIFTVMNYLLPKNDVMSMHCSANIGEEGDTAIFFGLSGTGKTTLSTDPERYLIGDDEHGWNESGVFNIEGGCYAKVIKLSAEAEPDIYECTRKFGTVLENVMVDSRGRSIDLDDDSLTENTRASYPITHLPKIVESGKGGHPDNIIFLTYDAFGVLPPVSKLSIEQAMYHFISGYTAKVAGTEKGVTEPKAVFSACFGAPFMVWHPSVYAKLLGEKVRAKGAQCWLVNTGLTGGPYGVGKRFAIKYTRAIIKAILSGELASGKFTTDPEFGFGIPEHISGVPEEALDPSNGWSSRADYDAKLKELAGKFAENIKRFEEGMDPEILKGGPTL
ncbi:phosphoenolpyruvate carboxykinase (ATP) [Limisalsivibrio acetivorans]|uniref:phosphoenolpyruvate carboxykinase (ATP) n=1 Tax=Limisalsivibrio acetivorans TaxID=1304888 RepID=UPI0003B7B45B|nr:phosphoenolpyruvate carboxykinase (ATP) [Limisalsivibrio acetivorans]